MTSEDLGDDGGSLSFALRPLDPDLDARAAGRFATAVAERIASVHSSARVPVDPFYGLWSLPRPLLVAASILAVVLMGVASHTVAAEHGAPATIAQSIGVPSQLLTTEASPQ